MRQVSKQIAEIIANTRRRVTVGGYFRGFTMYMYRSTVIAKSEATEANSNEEAKERVNLRNKTWSLSTSNMVNINSTIHAGYKVRHMKRSASAIQISYQVRRLCLFFTPEFRRTCKNYDRDISTDSDKHCNKFKNNGKQNNLIRNHNDFRLIIIKRNVVMFSVF